jgi:glucose/arabinose dehydrogenase
MKPLLPALLALCLALSSVAGAQQQSPSGATATPPAAAPAPPPATAAPAPPPATTSAPPPPAAAAHPPSEARIAPHRWDVDRVRCADLLRASDDDRASAAMFYYGYLAAKAGIHIIDVSRMSGNIAKVMQLCKERPSLTVPQAFRDALGRRRVR